LFRNDANSFSTFWCTPFSSSSCAGPLARCDAIARAFGAMRRCSCVFVKLAPIHRPRKKLAGTLPNATRCRSRSVQTSLANNAFNAGGRRAATNSWVTA